MYSLLFSLRRSMTTENFCSLSQTRPVQSRASQGATTFRPVSNSPYSIFSFPCSNWVGNQEHMCPNTHWQMFSQGLMILTLIRAIQSWRMKSSRLYVVLVKHSIFYYICGFCELTFACTVFPDLFLFPEAFSLANLFTSLLLQVRESHKYFL
jgi:hypothetical protein